MTIEELRARCERLRQTGDKVFIDQPVSRRRGGAMRICPSLGRWGGPIGPVIGCHQDDNGQWYARCAYDPAHVLDWLLEAELLEAVHDLRFKESDHA